MLKSLIKFFSIFRVLINNLKLRPVGINIIDDCIKEGAPMNDSFGCLHGDKNNLKTSRP